MMNTCYIQMKLLIACGLVLLPALNLRAEESAIDFARDIRPILSENCFACHGPDVNQRKADLRFDERDAALGHETAIVPGNPEESDLVLRITEEDESYRMPPPEKGKKLTKKEIDLIERWIKGGAKWGQHWAFVEPQRPTKPKVASDNWIRNPIDAFVLAKLEREGLQPSIDADKRTLIRRATLDLTGLPPKPEEVDKFLLDNRPDAYERLVDRLLSSPRYGERMTLNWLDAARYADTHGYHIDSGRDMTAWRDWVISAFNKNMPFDQFTIEQFAGDLLPNPSREQLIATGFHRNHMINYEGGAIPEEYHTAYIVDRINTVGTVWLGLTVGCAQCHDHKYDPISQKDYYQFYAFFNNVPEKGLDGKKGNAAPFISLASDEQKAELKTLGEQVSSAMKDLSVVNRSQRDWEKKLELQDPRVKDLLPGKVFEALNANRRKRESEQRETIQEYYRKIINPEGQRIAKKYESIRVNRDKFREGLPTAMVMKEMNKPRDTFFLERGEYDKKGEKVVADVFDFLHPIVKGEEKKGDERLDRLDLARWLVDGKNPLTARVTMNRFWQMYFGTGLVETTEDFGSQGSPPSHPALLDWLATEFIRSGWDVKHMQRLILCSATYRQSSAVSPELLERDPTNRLLARMSRLRLPAEFIRDQALAVSGLLNGQIGGASVYPYQPKGIWQELSFREDNDNFSAQKYSPSSGADLYRRSMYTFWKRTAPPPTMVTLDAPDRETCTVRRPRTNTPLQALVLMNDPTFVEAARKLGERMLREGGETAEEKISFAFKLTVARTPDQQELSVLKDIYKKQFVVFQTDPEAARGLLNVGESTASESMDVAQLAAWTMVANVILNLDETLTRG